MISKKGGKTALMRALITKLLAIKFTCAQGLAILRVNKIHIETHSQ